jgi:hypothetical protein
MTRPFSGTPSTIENGPFFDAASGHDASGDDNADGKNADDDECASGAKKMKHEDPIVMDETDERGADEKVRRTLIRRLY